MRQPRRAAVIITGVAGALSMLVCVVAGQVAEAPAPRSSTASAPIPAVAKVTASPSAEFLNPLYVPTPPVGVLSTDDGTDLLWPGNVVTPTPTVPPRAVIRPA